MISSLDGKSNSGSENISHCGFHRSEGDLGSERGSASLFSWCFMVRIQGTINSTSKTAEEDFLLASFFPPLPPLIRFRRSRLLPSLRSSSLSIGRTTEEYLSRFLNFIGIAFFASRLLIQWFPECFETPIISHSFHLIHSLSFESESFDQFIYGYCLSPLPFCSPSSFNFARPRGRLRSEELIYL